tara:strand:+ start:530 stop:733 length:204 start_codon:yes stop_codon:yes gene_type:complete
MCLGNTTSPAATNTTNVRNVWGNPDDWERPEVIQPIAGPEVGTAVPKKSSLKATPKAQSSKTSGGAY